MLLEATELHFAHGQNTILTGVSLRLDPRQITAILGPNGCGKSTLLSLLCGQRAPDRGSVTLNDKLLARWGHKPLARALAMLPQSPDAPADILVRDLVAHGRFAHRRPLAPLGTADHEAISEALDQAGVMHLADAAFHVLSGGERQRVWIALALAQTPRWLLLDEPTSYLDLGHQYQVLDVLRQLNRTRGLGLAMVLHDVNHAALFADRIIALKDGGVLADGAPRAVLDEVLISELYGLDARILSTESGPICVPVLGSG